MAKYVCTICGWEYDEAEGHADSGYAPGTTWAKLVEDGFMCPLCGAGTDAFEPA